MLQDTKNQHYVWRHYLKPWLNDEKIWRYSEKKIQFRRIRKIVKDIYFYKIGELSENEKHFIKEYIKAGDKSSYPLLAKIFKICENASNGDTLQQNNTVEDYQSLSERLTIPLLTKLYNNDLSFWDDTTEKTVFSSFIGLQYTRTKKDRDSIINAFKECIDHPENPGDINPENISVVLGLIDAERIGNWIFSKATPTLIDFDIKEHLFTNDQPVYNLQKNQQIIDSSPVDKLELFYPLTPSKALVLGENKHRIQSIEFYNEFIIKNASDFVFSKSEGDLIKYFGTKT